jgi:hypothetical protein
MDLRPAVLATPFALACACQPFLDEVSAQIAIVQVLSASCTASDSFLSLISSFRAKRANHFVLNIRTQPPSILIGNYNT